MPIFKAIWYFLGIYQTRFVRIIHLLVLSLVILQIIISNGMRINKNGQLVGSDYNHFFTYLHITIGCILLILWIIFSTSCLKNKGFYYFFPYLKGNFTQLKNDIKTLIQFKLPKSSPQGIAACIQGLGLGALLLVVCSGMMWFILWLQGSTLASEMKNIHQSLTALIELYIVGHGFMGFLHFVLWYRNS